MNMSTKDFERKFLSLVLIFPFFFDPIWQPTLKYVMLSEQVVIMKCGSQNSRKATIKVLNPFLSFQSFLILHIKIFGLTSD